MIISGGARSNGKWFGNHLTRTDENERVYLAEVRGLAADDVREAFREMDFIASGARCKNFFYHANMNPMAHEHLTPEQWEAAADILERHLKLEGHARFVVEHEKEGRTHRHVVWLRIDPETMGVPSDSFSARDHERAAREIERTFGLEPVESVLTKDREGERPERGPKNWETFRGYASGIDPREVAAEITALYQEADSGLAFKAALEDAGYILARGDRRDFCIIDQAGHEHSLARRISGAKAAEIRARLGDIDREALPSVADAREQATAAAGDAGGGEPQAPQAETLSSGPPEGAAPLEPGLGNAAEPLAASLGSGAVPLAADAPADTSEEHFGWRHLVDRVRAWQAHAADFFRDESSGAREPSPEPDPEQRSWVSRMMEAGRHMLHGWRHRDARELAEGVEEAAAFVVDLTHPETPPPAAEAPPASSAPPEGAAPFASAAPPEDSGGDVARPGGNVEPPAPDAAPQEGQGTAAPVMNIGAAYEEALRQSHEPYPWHPSPEPEADAPHMPEPHGPEPHLPEP